MWHSLIEWWLNNFTNYEIHNPKDDWHIELDSNIEIPNIINFIKAR